MVYVKSAVAYSVAAYTKTSDLISGQYQFIGKGVLNLYGLASATGLNVSLKINGVSIIDDEPIASIGATGGLKKNENEVVSQVVQGGRLELFLRNTTAGALTMDYILEYTPTK